MALINILNPITVLLFFICFLVLTVMSQEIYLLLWNAIIILYISYKTSLIKTIFSQLYLFLPVFVFLFLYFIIFSPDIPYSIVTLKIIIILSISTILSRSIRIDQFIGLFRYFRLPVRYAIYTAILLKLVEKIKSDLLDIIFVLNIKKSNIKKASNSLYNKILFNIIYLKAIPVLIYKTSANSREISEAMIIRGINPNNIRIKGNIPNFTQDDIFVLISIILTVIIWWKLT